MSKRYFQMCEILTCGRYARGERFAYRSFRNYVEIRRGGRLIYRDNTWYEPELFSMKETGMMEGFTHQANLFVTKPEDGEAFCEEVRKLLEDERKNCQVESHGLQRAIMQSDCSAGAVRCWKN